MLSRADIKLPAMPWTGNDTALQHSFAEWPTSVWTDTVEYVKLPVDVEHRVDVSVRDYFGGSANWYVVS
jgi:hypothetical protein